MPETSFVDADVEHIIILVSFQSLLHIESTADYENDVRRRVPVEGHFCVVAHPWGPKESSRVLFNKGFIHIPHTSLYPHTKNCEEEWLLGLKSRHGIAPDIIGNKTNNAIIRSDLVKVSRRYFTDAANIADASIILVNQETESLLDQFTDMLSTVKRFKMQNGSKDTGNTLVFITLPQQEYMTRAALSWFTKLGAELPDYAVVSIDELIPASIDFLENDDIDVIRNRKESRCAMHPEIYKNIYGHPYKCCRADVKLLYLIKERLTDYLTNIELKSSPRFTLPTRAFEDYDSSSD